MHASSGTRLFVFAIFCAACSVLSSAASTRITTADQSIEGVSDWYSPGPQTPRPLWDLWLRFHELELCQDLDTLFVFNRDGVEIWCVVEDEKSYQKLAAMVEALKGSRTIELYATRRPVSKKPAEEKEPPPSLWNNTELLSYISEPFVRFSQPGAYGSERGTDENAIQTRNLLVKQRLILFAAQVSDWNKRIRRYGIDLPVLAREGFATETPADFRKRAASVCLAHAQGLDKYSQRLADNIGQALPKASRHSEQPETIKGPEVSGPPVEIAQNIFSMSVGVARRVYRFLHPMQHTVDISDLRESGLLDSLHSLHLLVAGLHEAASKHP